MPIDRFYYDHDTYPARVSPAAENSFIALFPRDRKPDTINPSPAGLDDIMADNWSFRHLSEHARERKKGTEKEENSEAEGWTRRRRRRDG